MLESKAYTTLPRQVLDLHDLNHVAQLGDRCPFSCLIFTSIRTVASSLSKIMTLETSAKFSEVSLAFQIWAPQILQALQALSLLNVICYLVNVSFLSYYYLMYTCVCMCMCVCVHVCVSPCVVLMCERGVYGHDTTYV